MNLRPSSILAVAICSLATISLKAQTFTWVPTAASTTYNWTDSFNWDPSTGFPNAAGAIANVNNDIAGTQTIRLQQGITVGTLNFGDANGTHAFTIATIGANTLTFDSGVLGSAAQLNLENNGAIGHTISAPITLASNLNINLEPITAAVNTDSARLTISGAINLGSRTLTLTGGLLLTTGTDINQFTLSGALSGDGTLINNSNSPFQLNSGGKAGFTGILIANSQATGGSNTGTFTLDAATSVANAAEIVLNGAFSVGSTQLGGSIHSGATINTTTNPSQRFTSNTITFNSGTMRAHGWVASAVAAGDVGTGTGTDTPWRRGEEFIQDTVATMNMNSGINRIEVAVNGTTTAGTILTATHLIRGTGAALVVSHQNGAQILGGPVVEDSPRFFIGNANDFLVGGDGLTPTNQKIIPWIGVTAVGGSSTTIGNSGGFSTYGVNGLRLLDVTTEYAQSIAAAGPTDNVNTDIVLLGGTGSTATINSLRFTAGQNGSRNIGIGNTINITSGALFLLNTGTKLGIPGDQAAGAINFGSAEGLIWSNAANINTIGASISGSLGITKTGTGTLILAGQNTYAGLTYVGGGTLQVGDGLVSPSNLGISGDVIVANGATLSLLNGLAIADDATLTLQQFGLFNGKVNLALGVDETIGSLFFNNAFAPAGTYGSTLSGAMFQNDTYFSGSGVLTVVPEPGSAAMLLGSIVGLLGLRRRRV